MGTLPFPSPQPAASRTGANRCCPLGRALSLPSLGSCPCQAGREDVLGLDPSSQEGGGAAGHAPLSPLNPSAPGRGRGLGASDPGARCPPPFRGTRDHPGSVKGEECRSSEGLSQEGTAQHSQRNSRIAEKGDVWFVLTTQTDALRHVCIYGIHMLSWEIRGQQHKTRIRDANAKKTCMATSLPLHMFLRRCLFLAYRQLLDLLATFSTFTFPLLCKKCVRSQHPFPHRSSGSAASVHFF